MPRIFGFGNRVAGGLKLAQPLRVRIVNSLQALRQAEADIDSTEELSSDLETNQLSPYLGDPKIISFGIGTDRYQWVWPVSHPESIWDHRDIGRIAHKMKGHFIIGQNWKFDMKWIRELYGVWLPAGFDTMLASHAIDENQFHDLESIAYRLFGARAWDIPLKEKQGEAPYRVIAEYHGKDLYYTRASYKPLKRMLAQDPAVEKLFYKMRMKSSFNYGKFERNGAFLDEAKLEDAEEFWIERRDDCLRQLDKLFPTDKEYKIKKTKEKRRGYNFNSPDQVAHCLFNVAGLEPLDKTAKGKYSTNESVLKRLAEEHPAPRLIIDYREAAKQLDNYISNFKNGRDSKGFIHPSFNLIGTVTGRLSSEFHTVPRDPRIRSLITSPEGWTLVEADYSQVELRLVADSSGDTELKLAYQNGEDIHTKTVQRIFHIAKPTKEERKKGKAVNFGFVYGMWWKKFIAVARDDYGVTFTPAEAKSTRKNFFRMYSSLKTWHVSQKRFAHRNGYVRSKIGWKRRLPSLLDHPFKDGFDDSLTFEQSEAQRQAVNAPIQSLASQMMEMALNELAEITRPTYLKIFGHIHDAGMFYVRNDCLAELLPVIKKVLERPSLLNELDVHFSVPIVADLKIGPWGLGEEVKDLPAYLKRLQSVA
jgi:DNA polymerase I - 3''-5'' exonuclease and polymerase domains